MRMKSTAHTIRLGMIPGPALVAMYEATDRDDIAGQMAIDRAIREWNQRAKREGHGAVRDPLVSTGAIS